MAKEVIDLSRIQSLHPYWRRIVEAVLVQKPPQVTRD